MAEIKATDVTLGYEGQSVVSSLTFEVNAGDYLLIVGENGSGKSTLIKAILKLKTPMSGSFVFGDGLKQSAIGYLPQQTLVQRDFPASVEEIVLSGCLNHMGSTPFYSKNEKQHAASAMERLHITDLSRKCYRELSGGQQQRVLLARALCAAKRMLLLDEPTAGLDPTATRELYELIAMLNRDGVTILMVSHDLLSSLRYATHILHIGRGKPYFATKEEYLKSEYAINEFTTTEEKA